MKKIYVLTLLLFLSACTTAPFSPPQTFLYTDIKAPLSLEFDKTELGPKQGTASTYSFFGLVSAGDASIQQAARNGQIKKVTHADYEHFNFLFFQKTSVIVYGE